MANVHIFLTIVFIVQVAKINAQGEQCITPYDVVGLCVPRPQCHSPLDLFYFDFVLFKNDLCSRSERFTNGRPFVCCTHPIVRRPQLFPSIQPDVRTFGLPGTTPLAAQTLPQTVQPTTPENTTPAAAASPRTTTSPDTNLQTTTQVAPQIPPDPLAPTTPQTSSESNPQTTTQTTLRSNASVPDSMSCMDPRGVEGFCCNPTDCPFLNIEYERKRFFFTYEDQYRVYIQQSTSICIAHSDDSICCPRRRTTTETPSTTTTTTTTTTVAPPEPNIPFGRLLTPLEGCGYSNVTHKRISDGNVAERATFPWIALIGYLNESNQLSFNCGGSLITSRHVLTAAHCVTTTLFSVRLGAYNITSTNDEAIQDVNVIRAERHPDYDGRYGTNDIAILFLERDVDATPEIRPICLPVNETIRSRTFVGYLPFIAGWDLARFNENSTTLLREMQVPVLNNDECREQYQRQNRIILENQFGNDVICTGAYISGYDKCVSDSGSPLMLPIFNSDTLDDRYYQIGIISREIGCDQAETLDIYSRVQNFIDWIQQSIAQ